MITAEFNGSEGGVIRTDIDYRQAGILINPTSLQNYPYPANAAIYSATTDVVVSSGFGGFISDEMVYQGPASNPTFTATALSFNSTTNVVRLINITGTPVNNQVIHGNTSGSARTLLSLNSPDFNIGSGYITYIENLTGKIGRAHV